MFCCCFWVWWKLMGLPYSLFKSVLGPDLEDNDCKAQAREVKKQLALVLVFCCSIYLNLVEIKSKAQTWEGCDAWGGRSARHALYCHTPCFYFLCHIPWCLIGTAYATCTPLLSSSMSCHLFGLKWSKWREATKYIHLCCFISVKRLPWKLDYRAHISGHLCDY